MSLYKIPFNPKAGMPATIKAFAKINGMNVLPDVVLPRPSKKRKQALSRTSPNRQLHRALVVKIVDFLNLYGWHAWIVEVAAAQVHGRYLKDNRRLKGMWDILAFDRTFNQHWIEVKIYPDNLSSDQIIFGVLAEASGDTCWILQKFQDVYDLYDPVKELGGPSVAYAS